MIKTEEHHRDTATPNVLSSKTFHKRKILPPILSEKDKKLLHDVRQFIDEEKKKTLHPNDHSISRFSIYSEAFNRILDHVTVYRDILTDVKREYENCINAIMKGQKQSHFLKSKIKFLSCLPVTIAGYQRRKIDLIDKFNILADDNILLEEKLFQLKKSGKESSEVEETPQVVHTVEETHEKEEKRPIPGLTVKQWTDEKLLIQCVAQLDHALEDFRLQIKNAYVSIEKKLETQRMLDERIKARDAAVMQGENMKKENERLKIALDAMKEYRRRALINRNLDVGSFLLDVLDDKSTMQTQEPCVEDGGQSWQDEDDPSKEREEEMILEYIEKFNELFQEGDFATAAIHAANSPRGVLRTLETLRRFEVAAEEFSGEPSPLLLFAEALMHSSTAQNNIPDKETAIICVRSALKENRPDLVEYWISEGCVPPTEETGRLLVTYARQTPQHRSLCLTIAERVFSDIEAHMLVCVTQYELSHYSLLLDYAKNTAKFTKHDFLALLKECSDASLVWCLCHPEEEVIDLRSFDLARRPVLPLRFDEAIKALMEGRDGTKAALYFLDHLHTGSLVFNEEDEISMRLHSDQCLHRIVYNEVVPDVSTDWSDIADFCSMHNLPEVSMEIVAAITVKESVSRALSAIAQREKEEFDYYT